MLTNFTQWDVARTCQMAPEHVREFARERGVLTERIDEAQYADLVSLFGTDPRFRPYTGDFTWDMVPFSIYGNSGL